MNRRCYQAVYRWFTARPRALAALRTADKLLALLVYAAYPLLLLWLALHRNHRLLRAVLVPAAVFVAGTVLRAALNRPRPTVVLGLPSLLKRKSRANPSPAAMCSAPPSSPQCSSTRRPRLGRFWPSLRC